MKKIILVLLLLFNSNILMAKDVASYYADKFHGRTTANGEKFNMYDMTAAHKTLPFGTRVRITNLENGRKVVVRINDRGPYIKGRTIDLSFAAARKLGMIQKGVVNVKIQKINESNI